MKDDEAGGKRRVVRRRECEKKGEIRRNGGREKRRWKKS